MVENKPPYDATVDNIRYLCQELRDISDEKSDDLEERLGDLSGTTFGQNLNAAVILGLFKKNEDSLYSPTTRGKRIGYGLSDEEEVDLFREVIRENEFYSSLLGIVGDELTEKNDEQYLSRGDVQSEMGINFDFGVGDRTLKSAAGTFLRVMDAAGIGTYKQGRSGYPTRLVVNDEYSGFLAEVVGESSTDSEEAEEPEQPEMSHDGGELSTQEDIEDNQKLDGEKYVGNHEKEVVVKQTTEGPIEVQVVIEISSSDWESAEVINLIESLQSE